MSKTQTQEQAHTYTIEIEIDPTSTPREWRPLHNSPYTLPELVRALDGMGGDPETHGRDYRIVREDGVEMYWSDYHRELVTMEEAQANYWA